MSPIVEHQVRVTLGEEDVKKIIADHINENKSKYGVKEVFSYKNVKINFDYTSTQAVFESIEAVTKTKQTV